ncbi:MAG: ECF transporter S component [Acidaminococcaceae bacterium]
MGQLRTKDVVYIGMLAGVCVLATFIKIPFGSGAMVHLGTGMIFTSGILFGGVYTGWAAALGSAFYDLLLGFSPYTLWSFLIKGSAGFLVGTIARGLWPTRGSKTFRPSFLRIVLACFVGAMWTLVGYIFAWWFVLGSFTVALANIPASLLTSAVGFVVAMLLYPRLKGYVEDKFY